VRVRRPGRAAADAGSERTGRAALTRFAEVTAVHATAAATSKRTTKIAAIADLLASLDAAEVPVVVALLSGAPRQGRIGVGWRTIAGLDVPCETEASLEVLEVDAALTRLAATSGAGSQGDRRAQLVDLFGRATEPEAELLRRVLTGELRQGALEALVTEAVAKANGLPVGLVRRAAMLAGDLCAVAELARAGGADALSGIGLTVGRPVLPMLAATAADVTEALASTGEASVEWKLDGARVQAHRRGDEVRLWTRNLNDATDRLPGVVALVRSFPVDEVVLDGEAIGIDLDRPAAFQDTMSSLSTLGARFFDVLHVDGENLLDRPLAERLAVLDRVAGVAAVPRVLTDDPDVASAFADDALARGHEGVVVKALGSPYEAGRRGGSWRKVKPVRTLDLVVLAVEWGSGRRQGWLSNLWLGARGDDGLVMVGKTFKGMTDELLTWQTAELLAREVSRDGHVVHVRPELVVEVALDGVQRSTRYAGGVALRFARIRRYRGDKGPQDADTIDAVRALLV
jgi:DNA ligase-1